MLRPSARVGVWRIRGYVCPSCLSSRLLPPACTARAYNRNALAGNNSSDSTLSSPSSGSAGDGANANADESMQQSKATDRSDRSRVHESMANRVLKNAKQQRGKGDALAKRKHPVSEIKPKKGHAMKERPPKKKGAAAIRAAATRTKADISNSGKSPKKVKKIPPRKEGEGAKGSSNNGVMPLQRSATLLQEGSIDASASEKFTALNTESTRVPTLSYGLDRVLFNPGVYHLQDPRSRVYNFDPYLRTIMPVSEFDFSALKDYITSSKDDNLLQLAKENEKKYIGSSSSMTSVLSHFHYLLSNWRPIETSMLSRGFSESASTFTRTMRAPAAVFLRYRDGAYAIDADKEHDTTSVLMNLGKSMEKLLTMPSHEFERYRKGSENHRMPEEAEDETYHYTTCGDFLMRGQLDAYDRRLPGTGVFDLKTRAVVSIRMDAGNPANGSGYQIKSRYGSLESFEKEYYDMIRSAFLKYSLQVRIGRMDGIFVAYHNAERIFGFQYVGLPDMDLSIHGQEDLSLGDKEFKLSLSLWNKILNQATTEFPEQSLRFHFETREAAVPFMYVFAEPVSDEEINEIQSKNAEEIEKQQRKMLFPEFEESGDSDDGPLASKSGTEEFSSRAEEVETPASVESDWAFIDAIDSPAGCDGSGSRTANPKDTGDGPENSRPLLAMGLSIRNVVDGVEVERPKRLKPDNDWKVKYRLSTFSKSRGHELYKACQKRRKKLLSDTEEVKENGTYLMNYRLRLQKVSKEGRKWREKQDMIERERGIVSLND